MPQNDNQVDDPILVLVSCADETEAKAIAKLAVRDRLAACGNIINGMTSIFRWQGKIKEETETLLLLKSTFGKSAKLMGRIEAIHSYDTPVIEVLDLAKMNSGAYGWLLAQLSD